ncbi:hypothetical protein JQ634_03835 [Bradyrhizobium sp. AUGA SZCCT0240]|uniref:hypothetical protein n=1 Tax=unclassified Bradyrhizobium TaxID=2631580 RepID=UPI001BADE49F|nr:MULTISPECIES: hypothetical protein [unclassified Bradyrhizobium]MBR1192061.1 hypothetical protein [Bradyrhizobium sp. AUGA SZCCT0160]MBR1194433.1 hypothetical protein [Bradyrhizobium sp. AUGA SZCCT0158]MBR1245103.1 hypothetical protein [Bradyrhizobium sp. AUGA SZCCT0274]MBR1252825.1 hypothetical protein [Bradyrhizobium sp. AUGA SZCCT0240]
MADDPHFPRGGPTIALTCHRPVQRTPEVVLHSQGWKVSQSIRQKGASVRHLGTVDIAASLNELVGTETALALHARLGPFLFAPQSHMLESSIQMLPYCPPINVIIANTLAANSATEPNTSMVS